MLTAAATSASTHPTMTISQPASATQGPVSAPKGDVAVTNTTNAAIVTTTPRTIAVAAPTPGQQTLAALMADPALWGSIDGSDHDPEYHHGHECDCCSDGSWVSPYSGPEWKQGPPEQWKPYLQKFTLFPKLPLEIRQEIWKCTLEPRTIEIRSSTVQGFYSRSKVPVALRVNKDSRRAVGLLYHLCFGSVIHEPRIVFNFSMDTLFLSEDMWAEVPRFLTGLKDVEVKNLQCIAVDRHIDEAGEWGLEGWNEYNNMELFQKVAAAMPALKEFRIVVQINEMYHGELHQWPEGDGELELYEKLPWGIRQHLLKLGPHHDWDYGDDDICDCHELQEYSDMLKGIDVAKKGSIWGWRPTKKST